MNMYKKQLEIFDSISNNFNKNHVINASNGVGSYTLMAQLLIKYVEDNINSGKKIYLSAATAMQIHDFKSLVSYIAPEVVAKITTVYLSEINNMKFESGVLFIMNMQGFNHELVKEIVINKNVNFISLQYASQYSHSVSYINANESKNYIHEHSINAFDTPNFENVTLDDIINNTFGECVGEYCQLLITPEKAREIYLQHGNVQNYEFGTKILGKE